jgi:hypothetical protein
VYFQCSTHPLHSCAKLQFNVCYSVLLGEITLSRVVLVYIPRGGCGVPHGVWCSPVCSANRVWKLAMAVRNGSKFSQCKRGCVGFPWARGSGGQKFDSGWCFICI